MQAAQHPLGRLGMVTLYEGARDAGQFGKALLVEAFAGKGPVVAEHGGLENQDIKYGGCLDCMM